MTGSATPAARRELGGYELLYALKTGGMGEVLLARRVGAGGFEKLIAIKTIRSEFRARDEVRQMFFDEARLVARITHPAVAQVHDFGEHDGELYLAMEYVAGIRFRALADLRPPPALAARAMAAALQGLHAAHELTDLNGQALEVVHRDITPENLMLAFDGQVKVLDFGIALVRGRQAPVTELGTIKGKPPYLAPEQLRGEHLDRRTDVFSAAIVMHELLTGAPLFHADSVYAVARMIEHDNIAPPSATCGALPAGLDDAVMQALHKHPAERFQTAEAFGAALATVADNAGAESLAAFAGTSLAAERAEHRAWLRDVLANVDSALTAQLPRGRASGVMTAPAEVDATAPTDPATAGADPEPPPAPALVRARRPVVWVALGTLVAVGVAVFAVRPDRESDRTAAPASPESLDASNVLAHSDAAPGPPAPPAAAPIDAAPRAPIARQRPRPGHRPSTRARADAAPPKRASPPPPAEAEHGFLTVAAEPYALVRIDGTEIGVTPILRRKLAAGEHTVVLVSPDSGDIRVRRTITVQPGKLVRVIDR